MALLHREHQRSPSVPRPAAAVRLAACSPMGHRAHMDSDSPRSTVRRQVRAERERRGWSQTDLATSAGVSRGTVANLEGGMHLTEGKEAKIETALGKPVGWLDDIRAGRTAEAVDFGDVPTEEPARGDPATATWGDLRREIKWWHERLRDTPEDYQRLLYLLDLSAQFEESPLSTQSGLQADAQS